MIVDTRRAVLVESVEVATIDATETTGEVLAALVLHGRINLTEDRARTLYILNTDAVAAIITELLGLLGRRQGIDATALLNDITSRMAALREAGDLEPG